MCMRASETSELRKFWHFAISFNIFVGTSDTLSVQMTCLSAYMYRQISKCTDKFSNVPTKLRKSIIGGGGGAVAPLPPSGYANASRALRHRLLQDNEYSHRRFLISQTNSEENQIKSNTNFGILVSSIFLDYFHITIQPHFNDKIKRLFIFAQSYPIL